MLIVAIGSFFFFFSGFSCFEDIKKEILELHPGLEAGTVDSQVDVTWLYINKAVTRVLTCLLNAHGKYFLCPHGMSSEVSR